MSTQPIPPLPGILAAPQKELHIISQYLKAHEKLIIVVLSLVTVVGFYQSVCNWLYSHDKIKADASEKIAQAQIAANAQLATENAQREATYQLMVKQLDATRAALTAAQAQRDADTKKQQLADLTLPLPDLGKRWVTLVNVPAPDIQATTTGFTVNEEAARATVKQLEDVSRLQGDLKDEQSKVASDAVQIASLGDLNTGLHTQIDGLNSEIVKNNNACEDQKKLIRDDARKSKLKWFIGGVIVGYIGRMLTSRGSGGSTVSPTAFGNVSLPL